MSALIRDAQSGVQAAQNILNAAPVIGEDGLFYWNAINELDSERPTSMGGGLLRIPISAILTYAEYLGMTRRETDDLMMVVRTVDLTKCRLVSDKQAAKTKTTTG